MERVIVLRQEAFEEQMAWVDDDSSIRAGESSLREVLDATQGLLVPVINLRVANPEGQPRATAGEWMLSGSSKRNSSMSLIVEACAMSAQ